ncbi:MAG: cell division protein ZapD [Pseudomonadota bacterium]
MILYEYPLNERVRTLLRLEDLFQKSQLFTAKSEPAEHHVALLLLFEILEVASRSDLKSELLQELERQKQALAAWRNNPAVAQEALDAILLNIETTSANLLRMSGKTGQELRDNEWLMAIKQRTIIPGGACEFDLPSYHYWLHQDAAIRRRQISQWLAPFMPISAAIAIVLQLLRDSGKSSPQVAAQGVFQQMQGGRLAQMLRLRVGDEYACVPEISANKYALNIRFTAQDGAQKARLCEQDVAFELTFCNL